jgi:hypothetical protein
MDMDAEIYKAKKDSFNAQIALLQERSEIADLDTYFHITESEMPEISLRFEKDLPEHLKQSIRDIFIREFQ